jgi:enoyl-CoA hydratase/carnithine racemase
MLLTGDLISAQDAFCIGLVNRVVPAGSELDAALAFARKIVEKLSHGGAHRQGGLLSPGRNGAR